MPDKHIFLDVDNTLYSASTGVSKKMGEAILAYFRTLFPEDEAIECERKAKALHLEYYTQYGLAVRGLMVHFNIDPLEFNDRCDGSLPLEDLIRPNPAHRKLLQDIDRSKATVWALTNAYDTHAKRVLKILNLEDQIDGGIIYCDYAEPNFVCKPDAEFYRQALKKANVSDPSTCYFIDDNKGNVDAARALGWGHVAHFCEAGLVHVEGGQTKQIKLEGERRDDGVDVISDLEELRKIWPEVFK
ncbi:pyrimidine 5-nucleotidase [Mycena crocata]|nr:pyrimidine 5-nucleotidase [Mycena crocata]